MRTTTPFDHFGIQATAKYTLHLSRGVWNRRNPTNAARHLTVIGANFVRGRGTTGIAYTSMFS